MNDSPLIATCVDDKYLWPWLVLVKSAFMNAEGVKFRIALGNVNGTLSSESICAATAFCELEGVQLEVIPFEFRHELFFEHQFNVTVYGRLLFMDSMKEDFVWLDADLLLLYGWTKILDLQPLKKSPNVISAVLDTEGSRKKLEELGNKMHAAVLDGYFNAGVMQIDCKKWQSLFKPTDWEYLAKNTKELGLIYNDQDILNILLAGKVQYLPISLNHIVCDSVDPTYRNHILHFAGYPKPWRLTTKGARLHLAMSGIKFHQSKLKDAASDKSFFQLEAYWTMERYVFESLGKLEPDVRKHILNLRNSTQMSLNFFERVRYFLFLFFGRKIL
jgi:lipopolysaccharide biosynthesis glycosyltransferase